LQISTPPAAVIPRGPHYPGSCDAMEITMPIEA
jgi:hypothetical protein